VRERASRELDRAEAWLLIGRGRVRHAAFLTSREEDPEEFEFFGRALALGRRLEDRSIIAAASFWLGLAHQIVRRSPDIAEPYLRVAYVMACEDSNDALRSYAARHLGFLHDSRGERENARAAFEESLALRRRTGPDPAIATALLTLGEVALEEGRTQDARELLMESRDLARSSGALAFLPRIESALSRT
jgi:tetratricopeptide (TPR) repeat protein